MNENIDLTKILKDCSKHRVFYSTLFGDTYVEIKHYSPEYPIAIYSNKSLFLGASLSKEGKFYAEGDGECVLFPAKDQRDWNKFAVSCHDRNEKFDPKTLKPFDKVLIKSDDDITWVVTLFSHIIEFHDDVTGNDYLESVTSYCTSSYCIPYNDDTKHLVGTTDEAPEFYRYWEN